MANDTWRDVRDLARYGFEPSHKSRDGRTEIYNFHGIDWFDAPVPRRFHICIAWTIGYVDWFTRVERCPCGARSVDGSRWWNKNERRQEMTSTVSTPATPDGEPRPCRHPQAEPVILTTGELVACACIGCYQPLPADYIDRQVAQAVREAYCAHAETMEIVDFGRAPAGSRYSCTECGSWVSDSTWPTVHPG